MDKPSHDQERGATEPQFLDGIDPVESILLAAIVASPQARIELIRLGVCPTIFSDLNAISIASAAMKHPTLTWAETLLLPELIQPLKACPNPRGPELGVALRTRIAMLIVDGEVQQSWAVADVRRCAAALALRWLPENFEWAAEQLRQGQQYENIEAFIRGWTALASTRKGVAA